MTEGIPPGYLANRKIGSLSANLFGLAREYKDAANAIFTATSDVRLPSLWPTIVLGSNASALKGTVAQVPMYFCLAQSAELFLKSYLRAMGRDQRNTPGWSKHDLPKLLLAATQLELTIDASDHQILIDLGKQNLDYELRFQETTDLLIFPPFAKALAAVGALERAVYDAADVLR